MALMETVSTFFDLLRRAGGALLAGGVAWVGALAFGGDGLAPSAHATSPTLKETIDFTRSELTTLCGDAGRSGVEAIDRLSVGGGRSCQVTLAPGRLQMNVRQRGSSETAGGYARLRLDVRFNRDSAFMCGPAGRDGRSTLFIACKMGGGADGPACAKRTISVLRPGAGDYEADQHLAAASILSTDAESCGVVARALGYIRKRSAPAEKNRSVRDFFAR